MPIKTLRPSRWLKLFFPLSLSLVCFSLCFSDAVNAYSEQESPKGPVPLFNGKNLDGWAQVNCASETFTVRDGMIISTGKPTGVLRTDRQYENYIFEVEWRHMKPRGNAGIFVWSEGISAPGVPFAKGVEVQVLENGYGDTRSHTCHGDIFPIHGSTMVPDNGRGGQRSFPTENRSKPFGKWNRYVIVCVDGDIKLSVNGKFVTGGRQCNYQKGYICLEAEGSECHFRNLKIYELPSAGADETNTAPLVEGFKSLYSGLDLRNWKQGKGIEEIWKSSDWRLVCKSNENQRRNLVSEKSYKNYSVQIDFQWNGKESDTRQCPLVLGSDEGWGMKTIPAKMKEALAGIPAGKWSRLRIDRNQSTQTVHLNGKTIADSIPIERDVMEHIALRDSGQPSTFASIYVLESN
ncbi:MAG TPA: DUF1080 domain-containing protein [Verrucomicrobia bacterium]|nr:DUF1080 domain-containing protein [Verrucomicrobiota bacterium]